MKNKIFISHANPADNDFSKWLALKLITLGYDVWCDILYLDKGVDFWNCIENEIRNNTIKFLIVLSKISNSSDGVLKELAVATKVKKQLQNDSFIVPLNIDTELSYDDINIELVRLNAINFRRNWAEGLRDLVKHLEDQKIPKDEIDPNKSNILYHQLFQEHNQIIDKEEIYDSNWFAIESFPEFLNFHLFDWRMKNGYDFRKLTFPGIRYKGYLCTFGGSHDFTSEFPDTFDYNSANTISILTKEILSETYGEEFIPNYLAKKFIVQLANQAFVNGLKMRDLTEYKMSNKIGFWLEKDTLEKNKHNKILLVGKQKDKNWHFGISSTSRLYPFPAYMVYSHIYFTSDGKSVIKSKSIQQSARRRQGKDWWNNRWRDKLLAMIKFISSNEDYFDLIVGSNEAVRVSSNSVQFKSEKSYINPDKEILMEEVEIQEIHYETLLEEE